MSANRTGRRAGLATIVEVCDAAAERDLTIGPEMLLASLTHVRDPKNEYTSSGLSRGDGLKLTLPAQSGKPRASLTEEPARLVDLRTKNARRPACNRTTA
jgi:hypothetical protein